MPRSSSLWAGTRNPPRSGPPPAGASQLGAAETPTTVRHKDFDRTDRGACPDSASAVWPVRRRPARGKLLHDPGAERRQVVRPAAGGDVLVGDYLLVDHIAAGVADVGPDARGGGQGAAPDDAALDESPRALADHPDRLAAVNKVADKADGRLVLAQIIGI